MNFTSDKVELELVLLSSLVDSLYSQLKFLDQNFFPNPWNDVAWNDTISNQMRYSLAVVRNKNDILGFSLFYITPEDSFAHLLKVLIRPNYRKMGLGRRLLQFHLEKLNNFNNFFLEVEIDNLNAQQLYESLGFISLRRLKNFYGSNRDGLSMSFTKNK